MAGFFKHYRIQIIPAVSVGTMLAGASLVDAHSPSKSYYSHLHPNTSANMCAYECALAYGHSQKFSCMEFAGVRDDLKTSPNYSSLGRPLYGGLVDVCS